MVDPLINAVEAWLAFYENLPPVFGVLMGFSLALFIILVLLHLFKSIRG